MKTKLQTFLIMIVILASMHLAEAKENTAIVVEYIYFPQCPSCPGHLYEAKKVDYLVYKIEKEYGDQVRVEWIDATTPQGAELLKKYNIAEAPSIVINGELLISGDQITWENIKFILDGYLVGYALPYVNRKILNVTVPLIVVSGLVDGVNPCAFALLIFFLSFLYGAHRARASIFKIGSAYILSLFATYLAVGAGLLRTATFFGIEHAFSQLGIVLMIIFGLFNLKESLTQSGLPLRFPEKIMQRVRNLVKMATLPAASASGGLVSLCTFHCSGGIYIGILSLLAAQTTYIEGLAYLSLYNTMMISPLILILLLTSNRRALTTINRWNVQNRRKVKMLSGVFMIMLGILTLYLITA
jgi:cytochrome c biogenesis protein CcdA